MLLYSIVLAHFCTRVTSPRLADTLLFSHLQFINTKALFFLMAIRFIPWVGFIYTFVLVYNAILAQNVSSRKKIVSKLDYIQKKTVCRVTAYPAYSQSGNVTYLFFCFKYDNVKSSMPFPISISHSGTEYESPASSAIFLTLSIASITRSL